MPINPEKKRWIRVYEWTAEVDGANLPLTQADLRIDHGKARLVLKRAITEDDAYRRLIDCKQVTVKLKCRTKHEQKPGEPAVWFEVQSGSVVTYWLENYDHGTGYIRRLKNRFSEEDEKGEGAIEEDDRLFAGDGYQVRFDTQSPEWAPGIDAASSGILLECIAVESMQFNLS